MCDLNATTRDIFLRSVGDQVRERLALYEKMLGPFEHGPLRPYSGPTAEAIESFLSEYEALCRRSGFHIDANDDGEMGLTTFDDHDEDGLGLPWHIEQIRDDAKSVFSRAYEVES